MKSVEFCYWLQGLFEIAEPLQLDARQTLMIKRHLNMVFLHEIDQSYPPESQQKLNEAHGSNEHLKPSATIPGQHVMRC